MGESFSISIKWSTEDVAAIRPDLDFNQQKKVLLHVEQHQDANQGVTWETLECAAEELYGTLNQ